MDIKNCFISRYPNGYLIEVDYKQLEIAALAILSGDKQLIYDINNKVDIHTRNAASLFNKKQSDVTQEERRIAKALSFQLQYGAGPRSMADKLKLRIDICKKFIDNYYSLYPQVKEWQTDIARKVQEAREPTGTEFGIAKIKSITGRIYTFHEEPSEYSANPTFRPTQYKNYPVQGFATGDVVPMMLGKLFRMLKNDPELAGVLLINTVHDSVLLDCPPHLLDMAVRKVKSLLDKTSDYVYNIWQIPYNRYTKVHLSVDVKCGITWGNIVPYVQSK